MSTVRKNIYGFLRGSFLTDERAAKNWRLIIFLVGLLLIMISSAHAIEKKAIKIASLNKEKRMLKALYLDTSTKLMRMKLESSIRKKARKLELYSPMTPPVKITLKEHKNGTSKK